MDFELDDEQLELQRVVRDIVERECPPALVRAVVDGSDDGSGLWKMFVQLDWPSLTVPADHGGMGMSAVELIITLEELGRVADPTPFLATTSQYVPLVRECAAGDGRTALLGAVCAGGTGSVAFAADDVRARRDGDSWVLDGWAHHVIDGDRADELAVVAGTDDGVGVFVVPAGDIAATRAPTFDGAFHLGDLDLVGVRVADDRAFTGPDIEAGVARARQEAVAGLAAVTVGASQRVLDIVVAHVRDRKQFGVPIGSFQSVKHMVVDMYVAIERARALCHFAALTIAEDDPRRPWRPRWPRLPPATASASWPGTACSSSAPWASPGRTTCSSTCGGPRWASRCWARPPSTGRGRPGWFSPASTPRRQCDEAQLRRGDRGRQIPTDSPGLTRSPFGSIVSPDDVDFNEVFFDDVEVPAENLIGNLHDGWRVATGSLGHERAMLWLSFAERLDDLVEHGGETLVSRGLADDPLVLDWSGNLAVDSYALRLLGYRTLAKARRGVEATEQSILKLLGSEAVQSSTMHMLEALGPDGLDPDRRSAPLDPLHSEAYTASWWERYLRSFAGTIAGGTSQIQRNIIADRVLGLPR